MCQKARLLCLWGAHCRFCLLPHYRRAVASCSNLEVEALTSLPTGEQVCMVLSHVQLSIPHNRLQARRRASNEVDSVLDSSRPSVRDMLRHLSFLPRVPAPGRHFGALLYYSPTPNSGVNSRLKKLLRVDGPCGSLWINRNCHRATTSSWASVAPAPAASLLRLDDRSLPALSSLSGNMARSSMHRSDQGNILMHTCGIGMCDAQRPTSTAVSC